MAKIFSENGANVLLVARSREKLETLASFLREQYDVEARVLVKDLSNPDAPQQLFEQLTAENCKVDLLINNAGFGALGAFAELDLEKQLDCVRVNVLALTHLTGLFLPGMIQRGGGGILNVASTAAFQGGPKMSVYFATKAYVLSFTEAIAEEVRGKGVRVCCLCPGPTETEFAQVAGMEDSRLFRMGTMTAAQVARAGYRGLQRNKTIVIPGAINKLGCWSASIFPRSWARKVSKKLVS